MEKEIKYWLHRISNCKELSYPLFEQGYLTLGWSRFTKTQILIAARNGNEKEFERIYSSIYPHEKYRGRWSMWNFAQFKVNDIVVVPLDNGLFSICTVAEEAKPIWSIKDEIGKSFTDINGNTLFWDENTHLPRRNSDDDPIDLGFVVRVSTPIIKIKRAEYADSMLTSRMKMRPTNADISDLAESVNSSKKSADSKKPLNFYEKALEKSSQALLDSILQYLDDKKFELLVQAYMKTIGADDVYIPAKNEHGKEDDADADVIAGFEKYGISILIQVKKHDKGTLTDSHAVKQIYKYKDQLEDPNSELSHGDEDNDDKLVNVAWVISSSDNFDDDAKTLAKEKHVRLINGLEFSRMLINSGLSDLNLKPTTKD